MTRRIMNKETLIALHKKLYPGLAASGSTKINGATIENISKSPAAFKRVATWLQSKIDEKGKKTETSYATGATRDVQDHKLNFTKYFYPEFLIAFGEHMKKGEMRHGAANFKNGMPPKECLESLLRHTMTLWIELEHGKESEYFKAYCEKNKIDPNEVHEAAITFNAMQIWKMKDGHFEELLKNKQQ